MGKRKTDRHHTTPTSRGGRDDTISVWDRRFHASFHMVFWNMTPSEQHRFLDEINKPGTHWSAKNLSDLRKRIMKG